MLTSTPILGERERGSTTCKRSLQGEPLLFRPTHFQPPHPRPSYFVELASCVLPLQGGSLQEPSARHCRWPAVLRKVAWNKQPPPFPQTHRQSLCPRPSCIVQLPSCALESGNMVARPGRLQKYSAQHCSWPALLHKVARTSNFRFSCQHTCGLQQLFWRLPRRRLRPRASCCCGPPDGIKLLRVHNRVVQCILPVIRRLRIKNTPDLLSATLTPGLVTLPKTTPPAHFSGTHLVRHCEGLRARTLQNCCIPA